jgi:acyl-CoA thioesterase I
MIMDVSELKIFQKLHAKQTIRVVAFGSSNTQRFDVGMHWFDFVELGFKNVYGGSCGQFINSGITNNSTIDLLARFDDQLALYKPDLVIITVGANDCLQKIPIQDFTDNLRKLLKQINAIGGEVVLQTYYACDMLIMRESNPHLSESLALYMTAIREVAKTTDTCLIDQDLRWTPLRERDLTTYRTLMRDYLHLNAAGNMLMGLEVMRFFDTQLRYDQIEYCREGLTMQYKLDVLSRKVMDFEGRVVK